MLRRPYFAALPAFACCLAIHAQTTVIPLWPHGTPEPAQTAEPEKDISTAQDKPMNGRHTTKLSNITQPTLSVYSVTANRNTGAAAIVFPGGAYHFLAMNLEGTDACAWLNSIGMTCLLVKYRVPEQGHYPENPSDLEDAQQAIRLARKHAVEWHIDPDRIGVMGFSAGAHLSVALSTHWEDNHVEGTAAANDADTSISAHPAFTILAYPAYLTATADRTVVDPVLTPIPGTPPTFIVQAENDRMYIDSALAYYRALKDARVPAAMHLYETGGHGFGMHPVGAPEEHWTQLATEWLRTIGILPPAVVRAGSASSGTGGVPMGSPCPVPQAPVGRPQDTPTTATDNPICW